MHRFRRRLPAELLTVALLALALAGCKSDDEPGPRPAQQVEGATASSDTSRVIVVVMENKEHGQVIGSASAPYVTKLASENAAPARYYGVRHPSLPNYIAMLAGSTLGIASNCTSCHRPHRNLVDQLERDGISWRAYMEGMPRPCYRGAFHGRYAKKHNPFAYLDTIMERTRRCAKVVPGSRLQDDVDAGNLPEFVFVTPDLCNDTHDCSVRHGDRYLSRLLPPLIEQLGPDGFLFLTWEEGSTNRGCCSGTARGGRVPVVIAGPDVKKGTRPRTALSHYSLLRTIEDFFGLGHLRLAGASSTRPLDVAFTSPPRLR
jgi:phosphatidylinositol-3-phosphatase